LTSPSVSNQQPRRRQVDFVIRAEQQTSEASVDEIAAEVGYADGVTLRTLLRRKTGRGVRELRARS
jgi:transcriptional regulator GlxA family with amidase domain